jgi:hypothetical protein
MSGREAQDRQFCPCTGRSESKQPVLLGPAAPDRVRDGLLPVRPWLRSLYLILMWLDTGVVERCSS